MLTPSSLTPFTARVRRRLFGHRELRAVATEVVELAPADTAETSEAVALPGEIHRATSAIPSSNMAEQRIWARAGVLPHEATVSYRVDDATIVGTTIYARGSFTAFGNRRGRLIVTTPRERLGEVQLGGGQGGDFFFGHWLCDDLPTELLGGERGLEPIVFETRWMHQPGYRDLLDMHPRQVGHAQAERLWIVVDRGYNQSRVERFRTIRSRLRSALDVPTVAKRVYVSRGTSGAKRNLANEAQVIAALVREGFEVVEPEKLSPRALATALAGAEMMVTVEGSALCHGLVALPSGAKMLAIEPPDHFNVSNKIFGDFAGLRFGFVVADPHADGFSVDVKRLLNTVDLLHKAPC